MAFLTLNNQRIRYELAGKENGIPLVFVNGLTQAAHLWGAYVPYFVERGFRVLTFDMLGQGESDKPLLSASFDRHADIMAQLLAHLGMKRPFVAGISYGGAVALRYAICHPDGLRGLIAMGTFSEIDARLKWIGENLFTGLAAVGTEYLQNWFMPFNFSANWLRSNAEVIPTLRRRGYNLNDQYALENLMEAAANSPSFSDELHKIKVPTLILNGEYDYITPRQLHDILRAGIKRSRLVVIQHSCHAFTLEYPEITMRLIFDFTDRVKQRCWPGDQTTWIANDDPKGEPLYLPVLGDPLRAIQPDLRAVAATPVASEETVVNTTKRRQPAASPTRQRRAKAQGDLHVSR